MHPRARSSALGRCICVLLALGDAEFIRLKSAMSHSITPTIVHGIPSAMLDDAVALYDDAFGAKFAVAVPNTTRRLSLLSSSLNLSFAFAAIAENRLVGLAGYKTHSGSFTDRMTFAVLAKHVGLIRGTWAACVFSLYERSLRPGELLMDGIVVDANFRGNGIGTLLLDSLTTFAENSGFHSIRLDVIDTNPNARRMYERNAFVATKTEHFGYLRWLLGFGASTTLVRKTPNRRITYKGLDSASLF